MQELITIQIIRPQLDGLEERDKKAFIEHMSKEIAAQIFVQETARHRYEDLQYWQNKLIEWEIEDTIRRSDVQRK